MKIINTPGELTEEFADAVHNEDWKAAYKIIQSLIKEGNASAEHTMGWFHQQGIEVPQSDKEAFNWWATSAPKGVAESQAGLGSLYLSGKGTKANYQKAYYWLSLAVKNGETYVESEALQAKGKLSIWQYLYIKVILLLKT
jgi:TPR repeat protein